MGWGPRTPAAHPYPKSWQVTPPPPPVAKVHEATLQVLLKNMVSVSSKRKGPIFEA